MSELLQNELDNLLSGNQIYTDLSSDWNYYLQSFLGGTRYRNAGHLTRYQLETDQEYSSRLDTTHLDNHCKGTIDVYNSFLFREAPYRNLGNLSNMYEAEEFLHDADFDGRSLNSFMKDVSQWASVFGNCWIVLCKPYVGAETRADEMYQEARPYATLVTPLAMLDWRWKRKPNGAYILSYIKYVEDINGSVKTVKEWTADEIKTTIVQTQMILGRETSKEIIEQTIEQNGMGHIPACCVYNTKGLVRGIGNSDITDIADAQRSIYNLNSNIEEAIRLDAHPSLVQTPDVIGTSTGPGSIIQIPNDLDPGLKPYLLETSGASIRSILDTITTYVESIDTMSNVGGVRATQTRTMSGIALQTEFQLLNARLAEKADNLELAEEQLWQHFAHYYDREWDGEVNYPGSFNIQDASNEIAQLKVAAETATDEGALRLINEKLVSILGSDPKEVLTGIEPGTDNYNNTQ